MRMKSVFKSRTFRIILNVLQAKLNSLRDFQFLQRKVLIFHSVQKIEIVKIPLCDIYKLH